MVFSSISLTLALDTKTPFLKISNPLIISEENLSEEGSSNFGCLADVCKNKFLISVFPMGLFNYGGLMAIQTLWAGPWMTRVAGYTPLESATGLFWINITMLVSFFLWGYFFY